VTRLRLDTDRLRRQLASWYAGARRPLPWRERTDAYAIWISEIMLQQTTVAAVTPYWQRFLATFPDIESLAAAPEEEVLRLWSGLGYYARARRLHRAARTLVEQGERDLPRDPADLRRLPGFGRYTAAAVASIAFGVAEPAVDGNAERVLVRLLGAEGDPRRQPLRDRIGATAAALLDPRRPGDGNQALMELGATVCTPRRPRCLACPWQDSCAGRAAGRAEELPHRPARRSPVDVLRGAVWLEDDRGRVLLARQPAGAPNADLWELPAADLHHGARDRGAPPARWTHRLARRLEQALAERWALAVRVGPPRRRLRHGITHHRITLQVVGGALAAPVDRPEELRWVEPERAAELPLTGVARKLLARPTAPGHGDGHRPRPRALDRRAAARPAARRPPGPARGR
jgi:A/G-specific adenine glycosylase